MDTELKAKWIEALRSGKFKQGRGRLRSGDSYCCLGVACAVWGLSIDERQDCIIQPDGALGRPYDPLKDYGLIDNMRGPLIAMNDGGKSFSEIAQYIEENL